MRLLTLMVLVVMGAVGVRTQQDKPSPYKTHGDINGLVWREDSHDAKLSYVNGAMAGYIEGACAVLWRVKGPIADCTGDTAIPAWLRSDATVGDIVKEMDSFYQDGANISLPMISAFVYSYMKLEGSTKAELASYLKAVR